MSNIQVLNPTSPATTRTTTLLFKPFHRKLYFAIALAAALTLLGDELSIDTLLHLAALALDQLRGNPFLNSLPSLDTAATWLQSHLTLFILYMFAITTVATIFYLLYRYLNSRAQFVLLDYAAKDNIQFKSSWQLHKPLAKSYLKLRIWWDLILFNTYLLIFLLAALIALPDWKPIFSGIAPSFTIWSIAALILALLLSLFATLFIFIGGSLIHNIVPALMYLHSIDSKPALKLSIKIFRQNPKPLLGFFLILLLAQSAKRLLFLLALILTTIITCSLAFFLALIPVLGTPILYPLALAALPVILWERIYTLEFTKQFPATP